MEQTKQGLIENVAIDWVCPLNHNPATPYEIGEVKKLVRFTLNVLSVFNSIVGLDVIKNIGDYLDLEIEAEYPCSDGSTTSTVSVDKLLRAQRDSDLEQIRRRFGI